MKKVFTATELLKKHPTATENITKMKKENSFEYKKIINK
jgi:hypothetical protein